MKTVTHRGHRGAPPARREEGECREYSTDEGRRGSGAAPRRCSPPVILLVLLAGMMAGADDTGAVQGGGPVPPFLRDLGLNDADLRDLGRRRAVSRTLPAREGREVATLGAVVVNVPPAFYIEQLKNIVAFKTSDAVRQIGTFSSPARLDDVAELTLPPADVERLSHCRATDCDVQLSGSAIARFQEQVDWHAPAAAEQASSVMRHVLVDLVNAYRGGAANGLLEYGHGARAVSKAQEFEALVTERPAILPRFPVLFRHVLHFPRSQGAAVEDLIYWSREKVGPTEVISVTHMAFAPGEAAPVVAAVASKQIYGSHYFDASLGLTLLLREPAGPDEGTHLVYLNRSRVNALSGFLGGLKRAIVRSRTRSTMGDYLIHARDRVEGRFSGRALGGAQAGGTGDAP